MPYNIPTMSELPRPIAESYWVEPDRFLAGEYPGHFETEQARRRIDALIEARFDTFIDLTRPGEVHPYNEILEEQSRAYGMEAQYHRFPIGDFGLPTVGQMRTILDQLDESLSAGRRIYLHCWGGIGRTGTTVGCYLVRHGLEGEQALQQLAKWWRGVPKSRIHPHSPETLEQAAFVQGWAKHDALQNGRF